MKIKNVGIAFSLSGLLCCCILSSCSREKPLDAALERWQQAIEENDMEAVWTDLFPIQSDWSRDTKSSFQEEAEWYETEHTAFDGTMLDPYVERARKSVKLEVIDRSTVNIEGLRLDIATVELTGDGLSWAVCDWLLAARVLLPDELLEDRLNLGSLPIR